MHKIHLSLIGLLSLALSASAQNLIVNGGFEDPVGGGFGVSVGGWTAANYNVKIVNASSISVTGHGGNQVLDLGANLNPLLWQKAEVYQDVFIPAGAGTLSFKWGQRLTDGVNSNYVTVSLANPSYFLSGVSLTPFPINAPLDTYSTGFVAPASAVYRLTFDHFAPLSDGFGTIIDDVSVTSAVPEPATLAVLGFGALLLKRRVKR